MLKSLELSIAILGVLYSGSCYLPLDAEWPLDRSAPIIDDSNAGQLIVASGNPATDLERARFPDTDYVLRLDATAPSVGILAEVVHFAG